MRARLVLGLAILASSGCKIPFTDIDPTATISDAVWFAEEQTLFVFWDIEAKQGLTDDSAIEIRFVTDDGEQDWVEVLTLPQIHPTVPGECSFTGRCGVGSILLPKEPRDVELRLRYHRDGELAKTFRRTRLHVVGPGPAHTHRSLVVYGVFDATNKAIQWRARHHFPNLRNQQVQRLGLRRPFTVSEPAYGTITRRPADNPYEYGPPCPTAFVSLGWDPVSTDERAVFAPDDLPDAAAAASRVCGVATVHDATGAFATTAVAHKNPEVRPAFPVLRSPIVDATTIPFLVRQCDRDISSSHLAMQRQRLLLGDDVEDTCIDGLTGDALTSFLARTFRDEVDRVRADGKDMVLTIGLHHERLTGEVSIAPAVEAALAAVVVPERVRPTPRLAGAFLLDSYEYEMTDVEAGRSTIWCPSLLPLDGGPDIPVSTQSLSCVVFPDLALSLGPLSASALPIFSPRSRFLSFVDRFSEEQAGRMVKLAFKVPELPPTVDSVDVDPFGVATFFNDEVISANATDAFSYCQNGREYPGFVFRSPATGSLLPLTLLPDWHSVLREPNYDLGIAWEFPYLMRFEYELVVATAITAFTASLALGFGVTQEDNYGSSLWADDEYSLRRTLTQCTRHCDHSTFDSAGIYQVGSTFREAYSAACYAPAYPSRGDPGFPLDP